MLSLILFYELLRAILKRTEQRKAARVASRWSGSSIVLSCSIIWRATLIRLHCIVVCSPA